MYLVHYPSWVIHHQHLWQAYVISDIAARLTKSFHGQSWGDISWENRNAPLKSL